MARGVTAAARPAWLDSLDPGIRHYVDVLDAHGVETFESCQGGDGHCFPEPTIRFYGNQVAGWRALQVAGDHGLPVFGLRRVWDVLDGEPVGPHWEMTFLRPAPTSEPLVPFAEQLAARRAEPIDLDREPGRLDDEAVFDFAYRLRRAGVTPEALGDFDLRAELESWVHGLVMRGEVLVARGAVANDGVFPGGTP